VVDQNAVRAAPRDADGGPREYTKLGGSWCPDTAIPRPKQEPSPAPAPKAGPNGAGRRTRWMLRGAPESNVDKAERGYTAGQRLNLEEIARIAAEMGIPVAVGRA
jgi:hypothetical protein